MSPLWVQNTNYLICYAAAHERKRFVILYITILIDMDYFIKQLLNIFLPCFVILSTCIWLPLSVNVDGYMSRVMRKPAFCICENKDADQLRGNREADQRLGFRYMDRTIPLLPKSDISSL